MLSGCVGGVVVGALSLFLGPAIPVDDHGVLRVRGLRIVDATGRDLVKLEEFGGAGAFWLYDPDAKAELDRMSREYLTISKNHVPGYCFSFGSPVNGPGGAIKLLTGQLEGAELTLWKEDTGIVLAAKPEAWSLTGFVDGVSEALKAVGTLDETTLQIDKGKGLVPVLTKD
ncbi:MAG: hypothetical protein R3F30_15425 [Planctomycetota bacterium]